MPIDNAMYLVESAIIQNFLDNLPTGIVLANVNVPNAGFIGGSQPNKSPWARLNSPQSFGPISGDASGCYEVNSGQLIIQLFWPKGSGSQAVWQAAHEVKELYAINLLDGVIITDIVESPTAESAASIWFGINVKLTFQFEGHRS